VANGTFVAIDEAKLWSMADALGLILVAFTAIFVIAFWIVRV